MFEKETVKSTHHSDAGRDGDRRFLTAEDSSLQSSRGFVQPCLSTYAQSLARHLTDVALSVPSVFQEFRHVRDAHFDT